MCALYDNGSIWLMKAVENGQTEIIDLLLSQEAPVDIQRKDGQTALMIAVDKDMIDTVKLLLHHNALLDIQNKDGFTALMIAADKGNDRIIKLLLQHNTSVCKQNNIGQTALAIAAQNENISTVEQFLFFNATADVQDRHSFKMLLLALDNSHDDVTYVITTHIIDLDYADAASLLISVTEYGQRKAVSILLGMGASVNTTDESGNTALIIAAKKCDALITKYLLEKGAHVDFQNLEGKTALMISAEVGSRHVAEVLLRCKASVELKDKHGNTVASLVLKHGYSQLAGLLFQHTYMDDIKDVIGYEHHRLMKMEQGVISQLIHSELDLVFLSPICDGMPYVDYVVDRGDVGMARFILEQGLSPNVINRDGCTPLFKACLRDDIQTVSLLLEHRAEIDVRAYDGSTPISICDEKGHSNILKLLVKHSKETNLISAAMFGSVSIIKDLLEQGANVNQTFEKKQTALHEASFHGQVDCMKLLREKGAKSHVLDLWGNAPIYMAVQSGSFKTLKTITQWDLSLTNAQNMNGWTSLHMAIRENPKSKSVIKLKQAHALQVIPDNDGHTADYYSNFGRRFYHKDEEPKRDILGNLRWFGEDQINVCPQMRTNVNLKDTMKIVDRVRTLTETQSIQQDIRLVIRHRKEIYLVLVTLLNPIKLM